MPTTALSLARRLFGRHRVATAARRDLRARPSLLALEARDVPARYLVSLADDEDGAGTKGDAGAEHSGLFTASTAYHEAATPAEAVALSLSGDFTVTLPWSPGDTQTYTMGVGQVGVAKIDHKPLLLVPGVDDHYELQAEDLARIWYCDWDYNDHSWDLTVETVETVGGVMWSDLNYDGLLQTPDEPLMSDLSVQLLKNGVPEGSPEVTGTDGAYSFMFVRNSAAVYTVQFEKPTGYTFTDPLQGTDYTVDSDAEEAGISRPVVFGALGQQFFISAGVVSAPTVEITYDEAKNKTGGLQVAKWENAFDFVPTLDAKGNQVRDTNNDPLTTMIKGIDKASGFDIIDLDQDHFIVWVYDKQRWEAQDPHISVEISTKNVIGFTQYDDPATAVDLIRYTTQAKGVGATGWFRSDSQLLVSNKIDDESVLPGVGLDESGPGAAGPLKNGYNWKVSDRTHRVALRGTVKAEYAFGPVAKGASVTDTKPVPARHIVNAHVNILNEPDPTTKLESQNGVVTVKQVNVDFTRANEQFAQVGIVLVPNYGPNMAWQGVMNLADGLDGFTSLDVRGKILLTAEEVDLLTPASQAPATNQIEVYYVNHLNNRISAFGPLGEAIPASASPSVGYADSVIITADDRTKSPFTLAHEIGHILTDADHVTTGIWSINLMRGRGTSYTDHTEASKRLTMTQDESVHSKRPNLLT